MPVFSFVSLVLLVLGDFLPPHVAKHETFHCASLRRHSRGQDKAYASGSFELGDELHSA